MSEVIDLNDSKYPRNLCQISDPPRKLYYKGVWSPEIFERCLSVVGSRRVTAYGEKVTRKLVGETVLAGVTITSGFMYGVDALAHQTCLEYGGRTIAVMPCGIDLVHPYYQQDLYDRILENGGLVISEYEGDYPPQPWTYPKRNRIVAGLANALLVIEAALNSGSLITAGFANKFHRTVMAVPGNITSSTSLGCLQLIKEGAKVVVSGLDILETLGITVKKGINYSQIDFKSCFDTNLSKESLSLKDTVFQLLKTEPLDFDGLSLKTGEDTAVLSSVLTLLTIEGLVSESGGKYYAD